MLDGLWVYLLKLWLVNGLQFHENSRLMSISKESLRGVSMRLSCLFRMVSRHA